MESEHGEGFHHQPPKRAPLDEPTGQPTAQPTTGALHRLEDSLGALVGRNGTSTNATSSLGALVTATSSALASLTSVVAQALASGASVAPSLQYQSADVSLSVSVGTLNASSAAAGSTLVSTVSLAGTATTVQLASSPSLSGALGVAGGGSSSSSVIVSVVSWSPSLVAQLAGGTTVTTPPTNATQPPTVPSVLSSSVVRVQVSRANGSSVAAALQFVANVTVTDALVARNASANLEVFAHECAAGRAERVTHRCRASSVVMNLTCSGEAAASVRRTCPVPQRACSVLRVSDLSVASADYCRATVSGATVACRCGYEAQNRSSAAAVASLLAATGGAINVAVVTQFVSGGFDGSIADPRQAGQQLVQQSTAVLGAFGGVLLVGGCLLAALWWAQYASVADGVGSGGVTGGRRKAAASLSEPSEAPPPLQGDDDEAAAVDEAERSATVAALATRYVWSVVPPGLQAQRPWWARWWRALSEQHVYLRVLRSLRQLAASSGAAEASSLARGSRAAYQRVRQATMLDVVQLLTEFTAACLVLALVFDLQYPSDDGSCAAQATVAACLARKSPLDPTESYCVWRAYVAPSAGQLSELRPDGRGGWAVLQEVTLEAALLPTAAADWQACGYNETPRSVSAALLALLLASALSVPVSVALSRLMAAIRSRPMRELWTRQALSSLASQASATKATRVSPQAPGSEAAVAVGARWYARLVVTTPEVSLEAAEARRRLLRRWRLAAEATVGDDVAPTKPTAALRGRRAGVAGAAVTSVLAMASLASTSEEAPSVGQAPSTETEEQRRWRQRLQHATEAEFGPALVQRWLVEATAADESAGASTALAVQLEAHASSQAFATGAARYGSLFVVLALNVAALYVVALKGASRGLDWQVRYLSVCLLNWVSETWVVRLCEVSAVHWWLPRGQLATVTRAVAEVSRALAAAALAASSSSAAVRQTSDCGACDGASVTAALAGARPQLLESQAALRHGGGSSSAATVLGLRSQLIHDYCYDGISQANVHQAVREWIDNRKTALVRYGHVRDWDVSSVTSMAGLFQASAFNDNISGWDVSRVTSMHAMFRDCASFNVSLTSWNTSRVTDMSAMFHGATSFNCPIDAWDVACVTDCNAMFHGAASFNQPLQCWTMSRVTDMTRMFAGANMFHGATAFNASLDDWDVSNVVTMQNLFNGAAFNLPLAQWDVSRVTDMRCLFYNNSRFNQPLNTWDVSSVDDMGGMFNGAASFNQPLDAWNVSQVTDMWALFSRAVAFNQPLATWDVHQVDDMRYMFAYTRQFNQPLDAWDVQPQTAMAMMFTQAQAFRQTIPLHWPQIQ
eukprot:gene14242-biopygen6464